VHLCDVPPAVAGQTRQEPSVSLLFSRFKAQFAARFGKAIVPFQGPDEGALIGSTVRKSDLLLNTLFCWQVIYMAGWCPHSVQQKPRQRGSATVSLEDLAKVVEWSPEGSHAK
jgi:hypothetical protein